MGLDSHAIAAGCPNQSCEIHHLNFNVNRTDSLCNDCHIRVQSLSVCAHQHDWSSPSIIDAGWSAHASAAVGRTAPCAWAKLGWNLPFCVWQGPLRHCCLACALTGAVFGADSVWSQCVLPTAGWWLEGLLQ